MTPFKNIMAVFKLLAKTNCRKCDEPTCLAFAAAVFQGRRSLEACPHIDPDVAGQYGRKSIRDRADAAATAQMEELLGPFRAQMRSVDFKAAAERLDGRFVNGRLTIKILGKDFSVDADGCLYSDIHIHEWIALPFFQYILEGQGVPPSGRWVPLRELDNGKDWDQFFIHRCEKPLKRMADTYTDLFEDMIHLFNGRPVEKHYQSDISLVLHPLPKLPMLICYWKEDEGLDSSLNIFFDARAERNLPIESIYRLAAGLVQMFEKLAVRHGLSN